MYTNMCTYINTHMYIYSSYVKNRLWGCEVDGTSSRSCLKADFGISSVFNLISLEADVSKCHYAPHLLSYRCSHFWTLLPSKRLKFACPDWYILLQIISYSWHLSLSKNIKTLFSPDMCLFFQLLYDFLLSGKRLSPRNKWRSGCRWRRRPADMVGSWEILNKQFRTAFGMGGGLPTLTLKKKASMLRNVTEDPWIGRIFWNNQSNRKIHDIWTMWIRFIWISTEPSGGSCEQDKEPLVS